jgi:energy-coupling factor transport system substrate-specific component
MSWQLGSFALLAVALAAGFAWYERTRPDARIVALVATLAAFAALGRIAFAALPNVKPSTDVVLISGYALGGAPGFVVGAVTGLTSNFFFGQGPWTTWQMAAWAATGVLGAGLAILTRRQIGRWPLAVVCGVVGYLYAMFQDVGDWVNFSDHSLAQLGVYVARGIGFDVIHAAGCVVFALAFGPALIRSVQRFARRLSVSWHAAGGLTGPAVVAVAIALGGAGFAGVDRASTARATSRVGGVGGVVSYLRGAQRPDGGFGAAPGQASSQLYAGWAALGLAAAGESPADVRRGGASVLDYVRTGAGSLGDPGSVERTMLVAGAAGVSAQSFGGHDLVAALERRIGRDGSVSEQVNLTAFAVLALRAAGRAPSSATVAWLTRQQNRDGGFSFATRGGQSDVDDTGAALEALGRHGASSARAVAYLRGQQARDGGFPGEPGGESNAQSTAWAVQGLLAAGVSPGSLHRAGAVSPVQYLRSLIAPDGHVRYARSGDQTPVWVTAEALMALEGKPLPIEPVPARAPAARAAGAAASRGAGGSSPGAGGSPGGAGGSSVTPQGAPSHAPGSEGTRTASTPAAASGRTHRGLAAGRGHSGDSALSDYAAGMGILAALALAPVGMG